MGGLSQEELRELAGSPTTRRPVAKATAIAVHPLVQFGLGLMMAGMLIPQVIVQMYQNDDRRK